MKEGGDPAMGNASSSSAAGLCKPRRTTIQEICALPAHPLFGMIFLFVWKFDWNCALFWTRCLFPLGSLFHSISSSRKGVVLKNRFNGLPAKWPFARPDALMDSSYYGFYSIVTGSISTCRTICGQRMQLRSPWMPVYWKRICRCWICWSGGCMPVSSLASQPRLPISWPHTLATPPLAA